MKHNYSAEIDAIMIRPLATEDLYLLREWRNDERLSTYLRKIPYITEMAQIKWYDEYTKDDNTLFFAIIDKDLRKTVGTVALYNFFNNSCEVGKIMIGDPYSHGKGMGYKALLLAIMIAINMFNVDIFKLDVHEDNIPARKIYDKIGFKVTGKHVFEKGGYELEMKLDSNYFYNNNSIVENVKIHMDE